jgi:hypothetical protein
MAEMSLNNRTGISMSPVDAPRLIEAAHRIAPDVQGDVSNLLRVRQDYIRNAPPIGHVPAPGTVKGVVSTVGKLLQGKDTAFLIDRLGQRMAYERTGTRLYDAFLGKVQVLPSWKGGPDSRTVTQIRQDQVSHARLVRDIIVDVGADPTALTPAANVTAVAALGFIQVLNDPRTSLVDCIDVLLGVAVTDVAAWDSLTDLVEAFGLTTATERCRSAWQQADEHARTVRGWLNAYIADRSNTTLAEDGSVAH